jgi:hypothetical protein
MLERLLAKVIISFKTFEISRVPEQPGQTWALIFFVGDKKLIIPIVAIKTFIEVVLLFVVGGFAYNVGQNDALEQIKFNAYITDNGVFNAALNVFEKCYLVQEGNRLVWFCAPTNKTFIDYTNGGVLIGDKSLLQMFNGTNGTPLPLKAFPAQ